jgi:hypothetical protein
VSMLEKNSDAEGRASLSRTEKQSVDSWIASKRKEAGKKPMPEWDLHDLRCTMVTMMN